MGGAAVASPAPPVPTGLVQVALFVSGEGKLTFGENYYEGKFIDDKMLGAGKYVFKDGSQQIGEYAVERADKNNNDEMEDASEAKRAGQELITKWRCKKKVQAPKITFTEDV